MFSKLKFNSIVLSCMERGIFRQYHSLIRDSKCLRHKSFQLSTSRLFSNKISNSVSQSVVLQNSFRSFSSSWIHTSKRRAQEEEGSIFGDIGSSFGSAVPSRKKVVSDDKSANSEQSTNSTDSNNIHTEGTHVTDSVNENVNAKDSSIENTESTFNKKTDKKKLEDDDEEVIEIIEEKNSSIPKEAFQWLFLLLAAGLVGYTAYNYKSIQDYAISKLREWRSPVTEIFLPAIPEGTPIEQRKPVLVLNVDDLLLHVHYDGIQYGTRVQKRPHLKQFLEELNKYYEIVLFADSSIHFVAESIMKLEQSIRFDSHKLGLEYTTGSGRGIVKDLSKLGRPLSDVVFLEWKKNAYKFQPENTIVVPRWKGETKDTLLLDVLPFLISLSQIKGHEDFRTTLKKWGNSKDGEAAPVENIIKNYNDFVARTEAKEKKKSSSWIGRLFGK